MALFVWRCVPLFVSFPLVNCVVCDRSLLPPRLRFVYVDVCVSVCVCFVCVDVCVSM